VTVGSITSELVAGGAAAVASVAVGARFIFTAFRRRDPKSHPGLFGVINNYIDKQFKLQERRLQHQEQMRRLEIDREIKLRELDVNQKAKLREYDIDQEAIYLGTRGLSPGGSMEYENPRGVKLSHQGDPVDPRANANPPTGSQSPTSAQPNP
jgi:hypothetical protein